MTTKISKTTPKLSADENTEHLAAAKASREAFATAQVVTANRQEAHDNAELAEANMESDFSQGIDTASASDWSHVQAEVTRSEMLHNAAEAAEKRAEASVISTDVTLALIAQGWASEALKGVEVIPSFYAPKALPDKAVCYVIQRAVTENLGGSGFVAGKIELRYYRPDLYRAVEPEDISAAVERAHCDIAPISRHSQEVSNGMKVDIVSITIRRAQSETPLIVRNPDSSQASTHVAPAFACNLADSCQSTHDGPVKGNPANREYVGAAIAVKAISGEVTGMEIDDDGVRTTTVKVVLSYHREPASGDRTVNVHKHLNVLCEDWKGSVMSGFGRCIGATAHMGFPDPMTPPNTEVTAEIVFTSRVR